MATSNHTTVSSNNSSDIGNIEKKSINVIHIDSVDQITDKTVAQIMEELVAKHNIPQDKQMQLFTHLRLAHSFSDFRKRIQCVQARLQALSIIIYCAPSSAQENVCPLLYNGFIEELVDILQLENNQHIDIKSAALRTLTAIVHLDRNSRLSTIIEATETSSYHGFLPVLVRNCIHSLINNDNKFPTPFATSLFSFLYHLASYERGGEALVSCGMMESLLKIISWDGKEPEHITFVTRSVRVIDLITNMDMSVFQAQSGLNIFVSRLESEVKICCRELSQDISDDIQSGSDSALHLMDIDSPQSPTMSSAGPASEDANVTDVPMRANELQNQATKDLQCYPQRAALLKSMLNFLKKAIQDPTFSDGIRHLMDGSLPKSLRHMISNANYYGPSLFLLSIDLVAVYVFQEPALLSSLQESQLTKDILDALLEKPIPPTREILSALPNIFTALCLNSAGLQAFQARKPFEKIFKVLISPEYLQAMRRRRQTDAVSDTATNLGNAMDELMRHQPSLRADATTAIISLLKELCELGDNPMYVCCKPSSRTNEQVSNTGTSDNRQSNSNNNEGVFSDDDDDEDEDSASPPATSNATVSTFKGPSDQPPPPVSSEVTKIAIPLVDYIFNVMRFVDAILTNNSTDDHVREFLRQDGLEPLLRILRLKNLPIDFPGSQSCAGVGGVCKSILALAREPKVVQEALKSLEKVLEELQVLHKPLNTPGGSVLLEEFVQVAARHSTTDPSQLANLTPLLHSMSAAHAYVVMFIYICRTSHLETRNISVNHWGKDRGLDVLKSLSHLYTALVWESTVLISITSADPNIHSNQMRMAPTQTASQFGRAQLERLPTGVSNDTEIEDTTTVISAPSADTNMEQTSSSSQTETLSVGTVNMDVDDNSKSAAEKKSKSRANKVLAAQMKLIKPLLSNTSKLGKGLAELFTLLVKLSVGSPIRNRRSNHTMPSAPYMPSLAAQNVASALANLLSNGLSWEPPSPLPTPQLRFVLELYSFLLINQLKCIQVSTLGPINGLSCSSEC